MAHCKVACSQRDQLKPCPRGDTSYRLALVISEQKQSVVLQCIQCMHATVSSAAESLGVTGMYVIHAGVTILL